MAAFQSHGRRVKPQDPGGDIEERRRGEECKEHDLLKRIALRQAIPRRWPIINNQERDDENDECCHERGRSHNVLISKMRIADAESYRAGIALHPRRVNHAQRKACGHCQDDRSDQKHVARRPKHNTSRQETKPDT